MQLLMSLPYTNLRVINFIHSNNVPPTVQYLDMVEEVHL